MLDKLPRTLQWVGPGVSDYKVEVVLLPDLTYTPFSFTRDLFVSGLWG